MLKNSLRVLVCLLSVLPSACAQAHVEGTHDAVRPSVGAKVHHYVATHKRLLIADAIIFAAWSADAASSVHDQKSGCCIETNPILGPHPSERALWGYAMGVASAEVTGEHLIWWAGDKWDREAGHVLIWPFPVALGIVEYFNVKSNAQYAGMFGMTAQPVTQPCDPSHCVPTPMAQARARVMGK